jgi:2-methylcitrate dehydratase PrpD
MGITSFIHELAFVDLPAEVVHQSKRCLLDLLGVAFAGSRTDLSRIARRFAVTQMGAGAQRCRVLFDGRIASPAGAAVARA